MEGKNGLKIVCDSGAGFSTEQAVFLANNLAKKMRSLKQKCNLRQYSYSMTVQSCKKNAIAKTKVQFAAI
ncbi:hypothetical protein [Escherichia coli]|uniref:hypothetical protein n=1 Tax=Escherichia coli TaxID=562 RepID=UPI00301D3313